MNEESRPAGRRAGLLGSAVFRLAIASAGLRLLSFRRMQAFVNSRPPRHRPMGRCSPEELANALERGSRYVPGSTCLVQALAGQWLLQREGYAPQLRIGVSKAEGFEAHAWLELDGNVVIGGPEESARFKAFPPV
jgi:transglutaminase superfamily protein